MAKQSSHSPFTVLDRKVYAAGVNIFRKGELGSRAFIIEDGDVEIWRDDGGVRRRLGVVHKGGVFGEMALIDDEPRMANANALTKNRLYHCSRRFVQGQAQSSRSIYRRPAARVRPKHQINRRP